MQLTECGREMLAYPVDCDIINIQNKAGRRTEMPFSAGKEFL